jgi:DNA helicase-2/ATP-dependent DNA helicase PcrA
MPAQSLFDYVVNAFVDYRDSTPEHNTSVSQREVGLLFHDTAEQAANKDARQSQEWYEICERLASQRRTADALPEQNSVSIGTSS